MSYLHDDRIVQEIGFYIFVNSIYIFIHYLFIEHKQNVPPNDITPKLQCLTYHQSFSRTFNLIQSGCCNVDSCCSVYVAS